MTSELTLKKVSAKELKPGMKVVEKCFGDKTQELIVLRVFDMSGTFDISFEGRPSMKDVKPDKEFDVAVA